jgi:hypothetical protein
LSGDDVLPGPEDEALTGDDVLPEDDVLPGDGVLVGEEENPNEGK